MLELQDCCRFWSMTVLTTLMQFYTFRLSTRPRGVEKRWRPPRNVSVPGFKIHVDIQMGDKLREMLVALLCHLFGSTLSLRIIMVIQTDHLQPMMKNVVNHMVWPSVTRSRPNSTLM